MRYRYAKYGYYIPESAFTVATCCPGCQSELIATVLGDGTIQIQCNWCDYNAQYDSYESLRRCSRRRERAALLSINEHCEYRYDSAAVAFQHYTRELARALGVAERAGTIRRALASIADDTTRTQLQADAETHAWHSYRRDCSWCIEPTPLVRYYFAQLRNRYGY